jgi:hypothetical protein
MCQWVDEEMAAAEHKPGTLHTWRSIACASNKKK